MVRKQSRKKGDKSSIANQFTAAWGMPPQMVSLSEKETDTWKFGCMDFMDYQAQAQNRDRMEDFRKMRILSGDFNISDYSYSSDPMSAMLRKGRDPNTPQGDTKNQVQLAPPENIQHYPIMVRPINTIIGEYIKRINQLHGFYVKNESQYARNQQLQTKTEMLQQWATNTVMANVMKKVKASGVKEGTEQYEQAVQQHTPEDIQEFADRGYMDVAEQVYQTMLRNMWKKESLDSEFIDGFKSACVWAKEFYHIYTINKKVKIRNIDPRDVFYHKSPSVKWVSEGQYAGFRWWLTPSSIIDLYYDDLTLADMKEIQDMVSPGYKNSKQTATGSVAYDTATYSNNYGDYNEHMMNQAYDMIADYQKYGSSSFSNNTYGLVKTVRAYWKSVRKQGWLTTYNDNDEPQVEMVDENYTPNKDKGEHVEFTPCNQIYTGAKIGNTVYVDIGPYHDQIIDEDNLEHCPLPIEGCIYSDHASSPYSLVDLMTPWNEKYNIVAHELKEDMNAGIGKVLFMSVDHLPNIPGFDMNKWYYWARKFKIAWVKQPKNGPNTFNQFSSADMSFAQSIQAKMDALDRIQMNCDAIAGFSPGRVASKSQEDTLGAQNNQLSASVNQTEYLFFKHSKLIERVLNQALNLSGAFLKDNTFIRNYFDDYELAFIDYDPEKLSMAKMSLYVTNSSEDQRKRAAMESLMQPAMQNGADFADMSEMIMAETISEIRRLGNKLRRRAKEAAAAQQKAQSEELQTKERIEQMKIESNEKIQAGHDEALIRSSAIRTYGGINASPSDDTDGDGMPDMIELLNLDQKQAEMFRKHQFNQEKLNFERQKHRDTLRMDEKQLKAEENRTRTMASKKSSK